MISPLPSKMSASLGYSEENGKLCEGKVVNVEEKEYNEEKEEEEDKTRWNSCFSNEYRFIALCTSNPSAVTGGVICIRSMHNRKYTGLHTPVRFFFEIDLSSYFDTHFVKNAC